MGLKKFSEIKTGKSSSRKPLYLDCSMMIFVQTVVVKLDGYLANARWLACQQPAGMLFVGKKRMAKFAVSDRYVED